MDVQRHLAAIPAPTSPNNPRRVTVPLAALLFALLFAACSSGPSVPATAPATASPEPAPTVTAGPTATPTAAAFTVTGITIPPCDTGSRFTSGALGTAPGPTPTPLPEIGSRDPALVSKEVSEYLAGAVPVATHLAEWNSLFNSGWSDSLSASQQVQNLLLLVRRIELTCDAVARLTNAPIEALGFDALLREAIRVRHAWVRSAFDQLECCGNAVTPETETGNSDTSGLAARLAPESDRLARRHSALFPDTPELVDEAIGIEIVAEPGWLISADGLSPVLLAPLEQNRPGLHGLGPQRWQLGAAVRVRRLRNPEPVDVEDAAGRFRALITQQGSVATVEQNSVHGASALRHVLDVSFQSWRATVTVFVAGDFTYFIETGCPSEVTGACDAVERVAGSLRLLPPD